MTTHPDHPDTEPETGPAAGTLQPPTTPTSVVWCQGRPYVLESPTGRCRWVGIDTRGRPQALTAAELRRRGWSPRRVG